MYETKCMRQNVWDKMYETKCMRQKVWDKNTRHELTMTRQKQWTKYDVLNIRDRKDETKNNAWDKIIPISKGASLHIWQHFL